MVKWEDSPVPETICLSFSLDIFSLPEEIWQEETYDSILLCVDRFSGWLIAKPTCKDGLTAAKAAHVMFDDGWNILGVPGIIMSDQGPQFTGVWWKVVCQRLGIRQAYSQAHRPQANGRAQVADNTMITILRNFNAERDIN